MAHLFMRPLLAAGPYQIAKRACQAAEAKPARERQTDRVMLTSRSPRGVVPRTHGLGIVELLRGEGALGRFALFNANLRLRQRGARFVR